MKYKNKEWLKEQYIVLRRHTKDIGQDCGVAAPVIIYWTMKFNLHRRRYGSYSVNDEFFTNINNEKKAYWLGFIAADGCVHNSPGKRLLTICLAIKDINHLERFRQDIQCEKPIYIRKDGNPQLDICSDKLVADLVRHGIHPRKSKTLKAPVLREDLVHHWIRGYFDGDGSVSLGRNNKGVLDHVRGEFFGTKDVIEFIVKYLPTKSSACERIKKGGWDCGFGGTHVIDRVRKFMYKGAHVFLNRKYEIFQKGGA